MVLSLQATRCNTIIKAVRSHTKLSRCSICGKNNLLTCDGGVYDTKNVTFIEAMGREAGWLTAAGALAGDICGTAPDFVLLPEVPLDEEVLLARIKARLAEKNNVVVVVRHCPERGRRGRYPRPQGRCPTGDPVISKLAAQGNPKAIHFPRAMMHSGDYSFPSSQKN